MKGEVETGLGTANLNGRGGRDVQLSLLRLGEPLEQRFPYLVMNKGTGDAIRVDPEQVPRFGFIKRLQCMVDFQTGEFRRQFKRKLLTENGGSLQKTCSLWMKQRQPSCEDLNGMP